MEKYVAYNQLLDKVQQAGGYVAIAASERPCVMLNGEGHIGIHWLLLYLSETMKAVH